MFVKRETWLCCHLKPFDISPFFFSPFIFVSRNLFALTFQIWYETVRVETTGYPLLGQCRRQRLCYT
jgi:hypothetical protein